LRLDHLLDFEKDHIYEHVITIPEGEHPTASKTVLDELNVIKTQCEEAVLEFYEDVTVVELLKGAVARQWITENKKVIK
jgi:hypothetical protein